MSRCGPPIWAEMLAAEAHETAAGSVVQAVSLPPFQHLLDEHGPGVFRFLTGRVGRDAEDCFQETILAALSAYARGRVRPGNLRAWLLTIAVNKANDHHRGQGRRPVPMGETPDAAVSPPDHESELWDRVRRLAPGQRDAILLRYGSDLSYAEIGRVLGCGEVAARRRAADGVANLRKEHRD